MQFFLYTLNHLSITYVPDTAERYVNICYLYCLGNHAQNKSLSVKDRCNWLSEYFFFCTWLNCRILVHVSQKLWVQKANCACFPEGLWNSHHAIWKEYRVALRKETTGTKALGLGCYFQMRWLSTWDIRKKGRWMLGSQHSRETSASRQQPHLPPQVWLKNQEEHWQMLSGFKDKHDRLWRKPMKPHWVSLKRKK